MGTDPAAPGLGQGMDGTAEPGIKEIAEQALGDQQCIHKLDRCHGADDGTYDGDAAVVGGASVCKAGQNHDRKADGVQSGQGREACEVHPQIGGIK